jgi:poly-gamma-glutamate synthesis protein (capsule biosynthesis protein)
MIIVGDIASPNSSTSVVITEAILTADFKENQSVLFNLEGLITDTFSSKEEKPILFNHSTILNAFNQFDTKIAALANNHTLDLPELLKSTKNVLFQNHFKPVGAGNKQDIDFEFVVVKESGYNVYVMNACWDFLLYHQNKRDQKESVHTIDEMKTLNWVKGIKAKDEKAKIVLYFHWSFDLETLPFPAHRRFSKALVDAGASLVIGGHSHCIQGGEVYKEGFIAYGLGNFFLPNNIYANGKLAFPKMSDKGWVIEWDIIKNSVINHWFEYSSGESKHSLSYLGNEDFKNSRTLQYYSEFSNLSEKEYDVFFKKNRRKKLLIPVFYKFEPSLLNSFKMTALKTRAKVARFLAERGVIGWQN